MVVANGGESTGNRRERGREIEGREGGTEGGQREGQRERRREGILRRDEWREGILRTDGSMDGWINPTAFHWKNSV